MEDRTVYMEEGDTRAPHLVERPNPLNVAFDPHADEYPPQATMPRRVREEAPQETAPIAGRVEQPEDVPLSVVETEPQQNYTRHPNRPQDHTPGEQPGAGTVGTPGGVVEARG